MLHSLIMWLIILSLSPYNLHLLFCCVLSILAVIWLVLMALFCAAIRRNRLIGLVGRVFANSPEDQGSIPGRVILETFKMVPPRVKWSNPGKVAAPSPTPRCSSYWKGNLLVALDYDRQLIRRDSGFSLKVSLSWPRPRFLVWDVAC